MNSVLRLTVLTALLLTLHTAPASGHVELDTPNGGEVLEVGSAFTITWHVVLPHNTQDWDLWYSTSGPDGPWLELAMDLPLGNPGEGSIHTFDWNVPAEALGDQVRVRVRQDNLGKDYFDHSEDNLTVVGIPACPADLDANGMINAADLAQLLGSWGPCADCAGDLNDDGLINAADLAQLLGTWGPCPS